MTPGLEDASVSLRVRFSILRSLVQWHSGRLLTFPKDLLPAVSGMAKLIHQKTGDEYLAGIWKPDLHSGLLWRISGEGKLRKANFLATLENPQTYLAPSWSWERVLTSAHYSFQETTVENMISECSILQAQTCIEGSNPLGQCQGGHVLLRGKAFSLSGTTLECPTDTEHNSDLGGLMIPLDGQYVADDAMDWIESDLDDETPLVLSAEPFCDLLMVLVTSEPIRRNPRHPGYAKESIHGLLLLSKRDKDEWCRVNMLLSQDYRRGDRSFFENCETREFKTV